MEINHFFITIPSSILHYYAIIIETKTRYFHLKKLSLILLLLISTFFIGCGDSSNNTTSTTSLPKAKAVNTLNQTMTEDYQIYVEKTLSQRVIAYKLFEDVVGKDPLSGTDLASIHQMLKSYLDSKFETAFYVNENQYLMETDAIEYTDKEEFELLMMSLSAMLLRYDNYLLAYSKYDEDVKLNEVLNYADSAYGIPENTLEDDILEKYTLDSDRDDINKMITYYKRNLPLYEIDTNTYFLYLRTLIEDSPSYQIGFEEKFFLFDWFDSIYDAIADSSDEIFSSFFNTVSENIGNTAGLVEIREGKLYKDDVVTANVEGKLTPGDILVERTPFRLTDKLIPGYWGHIAVYIGNENDLKSMGIWDDINSTYQQNILEGKLIVEALRDGVQLNSVAHFLNVDDLAIMHDGNETLEEKTARIKLVIKQLGKAYDFEYDIEDNSKIVCSELVYITSLNIEWDTDSTVGINTISPDNVAIISTHLDTVFTIPLMYVDGELVTISTKERMTQILEEYEE